MTDPVQNFTKVTVSTTYDDVATSIVLSTGHGALLPDPASGNFNLVWYDSTNHPAVDTDGNVEIVRVTAKSSDTLTVTRAQESTSATTKNTSGATYKMILAPTAKTITDLQAEIDSNITTHTALGDAHHNESHTVASHSDTTATGAELETLTDGSDADSLHAHAVNDAKVTNATHTGDVTGATALTIGADKVNDTHIDWGTGVNQVSAADIPIADAGVIITATEIEGALQENRTAIDLNTAKDTNVSTDLSEGTSTETTVDVNSSDGTNATLVAASALRAGLLTKAKFDEIVANNAKVTNATHTGDVTGSTTLTIGANKVLDSHINWGIGATQVSAVDLLIADVGVIITATEVEGALQENRTAIDLNTAKNTNVSTALSMGTIGVSTIAITSDGGADDVTLPASTNVAAGMATASQITKLEGIATGADVTGDNAPQTHAMSTHTDEGALATLSTVDTAQINADAVTYTKMQNVTSGDKILGRVTGAGDVQEIDCTAAARALLNDVDDAAQRTTLDVDQAGTDNSNDVTLNASATTGGLSLIGQDISHRAATNIQTGYMTDALVTNIETNNAKVTNATHTSDVTGDTALTIAADAVTYAKMQNIVDDERILGRVSGADGVVEELTAAQVLALINVEAAADVTDATNVDSAGAVMESDIPDQSFTNLLENGDFESWSAGDNSAPDDWTYTQDGSGGGVEKITDSHIATYVARITKSDVGNSHLHARAKYYERYSDTKVILGVSIKSANTITNKVRVYIYDGTTSAVAYYQNSGDWEFIKIPDTIQSSPSELRAILTVESGANATADFVGAVLVEGSVCPAFSPKPLSANDLTIHMQTPQTLTGAGAVDIVTDITHIVTTGADALTLVDGAEGQEKFIVMKTDDGAGTLTPSNLGNGSTITFDDVGDSAHLIFTNGAWHWLGGTATLA